MKNLLENCTLFPVGDKCYLTYHNNELEVIADEEANSIVRIKLFNNERRVQIFYRKKGSNVIKEKASVFTEGVIMFNFITWEMYVRILQEYLEDRQYKLLIIA